MRMVNTKIGISFGLPRYSRLVEEKQGHQDHSVMFMFFINNVINFKLIYGFENICI